MRYFKFKKMNKIRKKADIAHLATLSKEEQKKIRKSRFFCKIVSCIGIGLFFFLLVICILLIELIPVPDGIILTILYGILYFILALISLIICGFIVGIPTIYLLKKVGYDEPLLKKEFISSASDIIRDYYGLKDNYLLTKCFYASDERFINHDICIFRYEDEIRITTDIVHGYINDKSNLGCYAIKIHEIKLYKDELNDKRVTVLEFGKDKFIVGIKSYSFIINVFNDNI